MSSSESDISAFLEQFKFFATGTGYRFIGRDKNMEALIDLEIDHYQALNDIILQLKPEHYCKGPEEDRDYPKYNVWVFEYNYEGNKLYVKLSDNFSHGLAKCISLHK